MCTNLAHVFDKFDSSFSPANKSCFIKKVMMDSLSNESQTRGDSTTFFTALNRLPELIDKDNVLQMIDVQVATLDRMDCTNKSLVNCSNMAQSKLAATTKLYKKTAKQLSDSKKDLDVCYKKILDLKAKIKVERPELFPTKNVTDEDTTKPTVSGE